MSKLDELIKQYCPDEVVFRKLESICDIYDGTHKTPEYTSEGIPFVSVENIGNLYDTKKYISEEAFAKDYKVKPIKDDVLMTRIGSIGACALVTEDIPLAFYVSLALLRPDKTKLNSEYLIHYLGSKLGRKELQKRTLVNAVPIKINLGDIGKLEVALPPLNIQCEIVRTLNSFTKLTAELTAELTARRAQYEYYRDRLLSFEDETAIVKRIKDMLDQTCGGAENVEYKPLSEIFDFKNGYTPSKSNPEFWENGTIPWFRLEDIRENGRVLNEAIQHVSSEASKGDVFPADSFIVSTSATIGEHAWITVPFLANQRFTCLTCKSEWKSKLDLKYIYYVLFNLDKWCKENIRVGNFASVDMSGFAKWRFPVPPMAVQEEIARILDKFNTLTTDIISGLPAEISLRQKQYEHYRDRLLNFNGGGIT